MFMYGRNLGWFEDGWVLIWNIFFCRCIARFLLYWLIIMCFFCYMDWVEYHRIVIYMLASLRFVENHIIFRLDPTRVLRGT
ncbi:hypothetical protein HanRHA438_Chr14g0669491 [Helianthus annuus]|nr:hypothetical protein HanRHA438_Chr14g0669491 [Helianthus annuus]